MMITVTLYVIHQKLDGGIGMMKSSTSKVASRVFNEMKNEAEAFNIIFRNHTIDNKIMYNQEAVRQEMVDVRNKPLPNPTQKSRYAYVTLLSGLSKSFGYRGFLYNALIMHRSLERLGSTADFIVLIGYSDSDTTPYISDMNMLKSHGIIIHELSRLSGSECPLIFAEMALLKITPYSFTQYDKVQFFDGDVMPTRNMDCFFDLPYNAFTLGAVSPLNSGWYMAIPNKDAYEHMKEKAIWRLFRDWDKEIGWAEPLPQSLTVRGGRPVGRPVGKWDFNGADMDQGLFTHYFVINHGNVILIDTDLHAIKLYKKGINVDEKVEDLSSSTALQTCEARMPTTFFAHFTGQSKPWMKKSANLPPERRSRDLQKWFEMLDEMKLEINSTSIASLRLGAPLGFWNVNFPKGGLQKLCAKRIQ